MSLLEQAKIHDRTAWEKLVRLYSPLVYEWCRKSGLPPDAAEVVGQEVFAAVFTSIANFRKDQPGDTFRGWLRRIVQRKRADYIDSAKRQPKAIGGDEAHVRCGGNYIVGMKIFSPERPPAPSVLRSMKSLTDERPSPVVMAVWP